MGGLNLILINQTEGSTISARPSLMFFYNRGSIEQNISSKTLCLMFVHVLFYICVRTYFVDCKKNVWFNRL